MTNPVEMLRNDHRDLINRFQHLSGVPDPANQRHSVRDLLVELQTHANLEIHAFYPWARQQGIGGTIVDVSEEEHRVAEPLIKEIAALDPDSPRYEAKLLVLKELTEAHAKREEEQILDFVSHTSSGELERGAALLRDGLDRAQRDAIERVDSAAATTGPVTKR